MFEIEIGDEGIVILDGRLDAAQAVKAQVFLDQIVGQCVLDLAGLPAADQTIGEPLDQLVLSLRRLQQDGAAIGDSHAADHRTSRRGACRRDPGRGQPMIPCRCARKSLRRGETRV